MNAKLIGITLLLVILTACTGTRLPSDEVPEELLSNPDGKGQKLEFTMLSGEANNHPLMAIWAENPEGQFIQTLYVAESIGKGTFRHGETSEGFWQPGEIQRPAALPRWSHQRGIQNEKGLYLPTPATPVPDAYTGPTPGKSFILNTRLDTHLSGIIRVYFEINQTWDWNHFWTNNKFPDNEEYKTSCQPALVYSIEVDFANPKEEYLLELVGRSHHSGANGELYGDFETMSTALHIIDKLSMRIVN